MSRSQSLASWLRDLTRRRRLAAGAVLAAVAVAGGSVYAVRSHDPNQPGSRDNGQTLLINNRVITPAGTQSALGDLPVNAVPSPDGKHLLVVNSGAGVQSLQILDTKTTKVVQTIEYRVPDSVFIGAAYSPDGARAYAAGGGAGVVHTFDVDGDGHLNTTADITIGTHKENPFPTGVSVSGDGGRLYVANNLANNVIVIDLKSRQVRTTIAVGGYPYAVIPSADGRRLFVSNWGDATISVVDLEAGGATSTIRVGSHPSTMIMGRDDRLFVADSNSDAVSVVDTRTNREVRRLSVSPFKNAPLSSSPEGLALSPDGRTLYVADAGSDEVAVFKLDDDDTQPAGRIPTAWYPTAVVTSRDGKSIFVTNAKGYGAGPNATGYFPNPTRPTPPFQDGVGGYADGYCNCTFDKYSGSMMVGTLSTIEVPGSARLDVYTAKVRVNNHIDDSQLNARSPGNPIPLQGGSSPIKHVIYVVKENRTYDQVFGDVRPGDGDPNLTLFPRINTPNLHALAQRFGILDNFYADAEVSADGHNWITSANASDYNEKLWPQDYSPGAGRNFGYPFEGGNTINLSPGGYLWDSAAEKGLSLRDYGEFVNNGAAQGLIAESDAASCPGPITHSYQGTTIPAGQVLCFLPTTVNQATTPNLDRRSDPRFRSYDLRYTDSERVAEWQREFNQYEANGNLPALEIIRLPNDHTAGTKAGMPTPQAYVAENDGAVGRLADIVSHSKDWASTAIFVTEDDAQNGPDHVDAHRTTSLVISPYTSTSRARVDHTLYDTAAMVRTMELILGLRPLSQFDATAVPMWRLFDAHPNLQPYEPAHGGTNPSEVNTALSFGAARSENMDFSQEDRAPSDDLNQVIWGSVKGSNVPFPMPVGSRAPKADGDA